MLIRYTGQAQRRIVGEWDWTLANHYEVEVGDAEVVSYLLVMENGFEVSPREPLVSYLQLPPMRIAELALVGVSSAEQLAKLNKKEVKQLAIKAKLSEAVVRGWVDQIHQAQKNHDVKE